MFRVKSSFLLTDDSDTIVIRFARRDCPIVRDISLSSKSFHIFRVDRKCYLFIYLFIPIGVPASCNERHSHGRDYRVMYENGAVSRATGDTLRHFN